MKQFIVKHKKAITSTLAIVLMGGITLSFQDTPFANDKFSGREASTFETGCNDTLPEKEGIKMKDFDKLQAELDRALDKVTVELKNLDLSTIQKEAATRALEEINLDNVLKNVELSLKNIDPEKMMTSISNSLKNSSLHFNSPEIEKAMAEASKEIENAKLELKDSDKEKIKKELLSAKEELEKSKTEIGKIDISKIMAEARTGIDKAKEELKLTREMFTEMEKDGLVDAKAGFTIEYKDKALYINGKKLDEKTTDKYRKYFTHDHFKITINKE